MYLHAFGPLLCCNSDRQKLKLSSLFGLLNKKLNIKKYLISIDKPKKILIFLKRTKVYVNQNLEDLQKQKGLQKSQKPYVLSLSSYVAGTLKVTISTYH